MTLMKNCFFLLLFVSLPSLQAQNAAPEYSREDMEAIIADQEQRVQFLMREFMEIHGASEGLMQDVVDKVSQLEDGGDSKTRVVRLKKMMMEDLQTGIKALMNKRGQALQDMGMLPEDYQPGSSQQAEISLTQEMIATRMDAVMKLANSLHTNQDVEKYETTYRVTNDDIVRANKKVSDAYRQNRNQEQNATQAMKELQANLDRVKFNLTQQINFMKAEQRGNPIVARYEDEIARKEEMLALVNAYEAELGENSAPSQTSVGSLKEAMALENEVYSAVAALKQNNNLLRQKGMALKQQMDLLNAQKVTLARILAADRTAPEPVAE